MLYYKGFYCFNEEDIQKIFEKVEKKVLDVNSNDYKEFKRNLVIENLISPCVDWESSLSVEQLQKLNDLRLEHLEKNKYISFSSFSKYSFDEKEFIFYKQEKGEVVRKYKIKNVDFYDIKVGKKYIEGVHFTELDKRDDVRKYLKTIPENLDFKKIKTERLLQHLKHVRKIIYSYSYYDKKDELAYWQLKKELSNREHVNR